ncbi:hypothetical protein GOBAR_AA28027 [Gossypium barbadense]|uniref:O-methyltransferase domain-containing protein n=1 Tax=Gossypium barbadense TaxID=3634 RepID=A0A2P5WNH4_GOSBA|nr:hypothetical protein GOBAR_AA28027 [Gossypium barbadense]
MSLKCAVQLGIPDAIHNHGKPITLSELVSAPGIVPTKASFTYRLMRVLVHAGFFATTKVNKGEEKEAYVLTLFSKILVKEKINCLSPFVVGMLCPALMMPWQFLGDWMQGTKKNCEPVFEGLKSLVDVRGGTGTIARVISEAYPQLKCTVFDLPHVVANLPTTGNLNFVGGDLFQHIPSADAILMRRVILQLVLHAFGDEECIKILKKCREAIPTQGEKGKVIIIDIVINVEKDEHELTEAKLFFDMLMMVEVSGRERTEQDWQKLFMAAGFCHYKLTPLFGLRSLIEVYP